MSRILIVDGRDENFYQLRSTLLIESYQIDIARNGMEALEKAYQTKPDLIITGILMPIMDGITLCRKWKSDPELNRIPLLFYSTSYTDPNDEKLARHAGADGFIAKPTDPDQILAYVRQFIEPHQTSTMVALPQPSYDELSVLKEYNQVLVNKLEQKLHELELTTEQSLKNEERLRLALEAAHSSAVDWDIINDWIVWSGEISSILGMDQKKFEGNYETFINSVHPEDLPKLISVIEAARVDHTDYLLEFRVIWPNTSVHWVVHRGRFFYNENDDAVRLCGVIVDITQRKQNEHILAQENVRRRILFEQAKDGIFVIDSERKVIEANLSFCHMLGYSPDEILSLHLWDWDMSFPSQEKVYAMWPQLPVEPHTYETRIRRRDGTQFDAEISYNLAEWEGQTQLFNVCRDITERKRAMERLHLSDQVFKASREGIMITDANNRIVSINRAFTEITGYTEAEVLGRDPNLLKSGRQDKTFYKAMWDSIINQGGWQGEIWNKRKNGEIYPEWLSISGIRDKEGRFTQYFSIFSDITSIKESEEQIRYLAHYDPLTHLPNRLLLHDRVKLALAAAQRSHTKVAIMFLDLDRFKNINDSLGHMVGDRLLQEIAKRLTALLREEDTICRLGGDEFILALPDTDPQGAAHAAEKILEAISEPFTIDHHELNVTASIGIAEYPLNGTDLDSLLKCSDSALYRAKKSGRSNFQFFTKKMHEHASEILYIENSLRHAIEKGEFTLHYQPQLDTPSCRIVSVEALMRWHHPKLGNIPPAKFIPIAEESGQIREIGEWVLQTALQQNAHWQKAGLQIVPMAVNLSLAQFHQKNLREMIINALATSGMDPAMLELELTESIAMEDIAVTAATVDLLNELGVGFSIDDFGTGYSSLSYLKRFKVNKLKIDRSFVNDLDIDAEDRAIVSAIINLGKSLGFKTVAEGVETQQQLNFLRGFKCDGIQGFYFSKPVPAEEFAFMLKNGGVINERALV